MADFNILAVHYNYHKGFWHSVLWPAEQVQFQVLWLETRESVTHEYQLFI